MWTPEQRRAADRHGLRYPSDLSNAEWALVEAMIPPARHGGRKRSIDVREVLQYGSGGSSGWPGFRCLSISTPTKYTQPRK
jgi:hypothetical protein